jgi:hypothetical protein
MTTTWNPADKNANITLSNGNLTATSSGASTTAVRSTSSFSSGKVYFEITLSTVQTNIAVGFANSTESLTPSSGIGADNNALGFYAVSPAQAVYLNASNLSNGTVASSNGDIVYFAIDFTAQKVWVSSAVMRGASTPWNNAAIGSQNPSSSTGGLSFATMAAGPYFIIFNDSTGGAVSVLNTGATAFNGTLPTGYSAWDATSSGGSPMLIICD